jgi:MFS family permease
MGDAARDTFRSFKVRNFRLFFMGQLVSVSGTWMQTIALIWVVLRLTDDGFALGLSLAAQYLPVLLFGAWGGVLADRFDRRRVIIITQTAFAVVGAAFAILMIGDRLTIELVYALSLVLGVVNALDTPARRTLVADLVDPVNVPNAVALNSAMTTSSQVTGPAIAGLLIATVGVEWCFIVNTLSFVAVICAILAMDSSAIRSSPRVTRGRGQLREGFHYVWRTPELRLPMLMLAVIGMLAIEFKITLPLYSERSLSGSAATFTLLYCSMSVGSVLGALSIARRRDVDTGFLSRSALMLGGFMVGLSLAPNLLVAMIAVVPVGFTRVMLVSGTKSAVQLRAETAMRGRASSFVDVVFIGTIPIGGLIIGWISEHHGARIGIFIGAASAVLMALWVRTQLAAEASRGSEPASQEPLLGGPTYVPETAP